MQSNVEPASPTGDTQALPRGVERQILAAGRVVQIEATEKQRIQS
jgi:hypothetical protein